jgi:UDP:flavonoid glycosyltransferase YjiC (YdhE family)
LGRGPRPLVFTLGSLIVNSPGPFYRDSVAAATALGKRAVLLVGADAVADYANLRSATVHVCGYASHSRIFPRAEAVVHQCGVGTLAQALRSGRPQLIVPFYGDQADNAARAVKLGVARSIAPKRYNALSAGRELARLSGVPAYMSRAAQVRELLAGEDGAAAAARLVMNRLTRET